MKKNDWESEWESKTIDELLELREMMQNVLMDRLKAKKAEIERKLQMLNQASQTRIPKSGSRSDI